MKDIGKGDLMRLCIFPFVMLIAAILITIALDHLSINPNCPLAGGEPWNHGRSGGVGPKP